APDTVGSQALPASELLASQIDAASKVTATAAAAEAFGKEPTSSTTVDQGPNSVVSKPSREKMPATELERRYAAILAALSEFNVKVERPRGEVPYREGPAFIEYAVFPSYGVSVNRIESQL